MKLKTSAILILLTASLVLGSIVWDDIVTQYSSDGNLSASVYAELDANHIKRDSYNYTANADFSCFAEAVPVGTTAYYQWIVSITNQTTGTNPLPSLGSGWQNSFNGSASTSVAGSRTGDINIFAKCSISLPGSYVSAIIDHTVYSAGNIF